MTPPSTAVRGRRRAATGILALAALTAALLGVPGCKPPGTPPPPRKPEIVLRTEADDRRVGEEAARAVGGEMGILEDADLNAYVESLGRRIVAHAQERDFDYSFQIVDQDVPNAFALPGGFIFVSRGLLILSNSEDELANVLCHEIIHVAARHSAARQSIVRGLRGPLQFFAMGQVASYSRDQEREADRLGQDLCADAGYDPLGMSTFLKDLEFTERLRLGMSRLPGFLDTHPATTERVATAAARGRTVKWTRQPTIAGSREEYLNRLEGLPVGTPATEGVFQGDRFLHPVLGFSMRFPPGWDTRNTRRAVGAISPKRDALVFLEGQGPGEDPELGFHEYRETPDAYGLVVERAAPVKLGSIPAYRIEGKAHTPQGAVNVIITFLSWDGSIYRITGVTPTGFSRYEAEFRSTARSFRPLESRERKRITETRLRIVKAREGEDIRALSERTGNTWDIQQTAVVNGVFANQPLESGRPVKIAIAERYAARDGS